MGNFSKLYLTFYKRLLFNNLFVSILFSVLDYSMTSDLSSSINIFGFSIMSVGFLLSLFYQEMAHRAEYYFYFNKGLSKIRLISVTAISNIIIGLLWNNFWKLIVY